MNDLLSNVTTTKKNLPTFKKQQQKIRAKTNILTTNRNQVIKLSLKDDTKKTILSNAIVERRKKRMAIKRKYISFAEAVPSIIASKIGDTIILLVLNRDGLLGFTKDLTPVTILFGRHKRPKILRIRGDKYAIREMYTLEKYVFLFTRCTIISKEMNNIQINWNLLQTFGEIENLSTIAHMDNEYDNIQANFCFCI